MGFNDLALFAYFGDLWKSCVELMVKQIMYKSEIQRPYKTKFA